jgi:hypothetical protein
MITFTDAEQRFADSPEGRAAIAYERCKYDMGQSHKGANAAPWTDAMEARTVRDLSMQHARAAVQGAAFLADCERQIPILQAEAETARQQMIERTSNAYKGGN